ncbi:MAG: Veg family protein [Lachnospiraceae bacterium]|nr:Veg family protein [Lachnospiraceae bacterium]
MAKQASDMSPVVRKVYENKGNHVRVTKNMGRNRYEVIEGTITETYTNLFVIKLDQAEDTIKTQSYSYFDILTKDIQLSYV